MRCSRGRILTPELLDRASPADAVRNLREIARINRLFGGHRILIETLAALGVGDRPFSLLDVGAGSGDMAGAVLRRFPQARVVSLDLKASHLQGAPGDLVAADAFALPFPPGSFDWVHCSHFLHHFPDRDVVELLRALAGVARRGLIAQDLERHVLAYHFLPATRWLFGWGRLTLHDGPVSVEAAFRGEELADLARRAGLERARVRRHRPAFRLSMVWETGR
ncbi:MAG: methyltransferase domain-containing protein [Acidobacteria bacterium]|nr:methyltransferase domain-containing protein [Acidobacteriota bacterium]